MARYGLAEMVLVGFVLLYIVLLSFLIKVPRFRKNLRDSFIEKSIHTDPDTQQRKFSLMVLVLGLMATIMPYLCGTLVLAVYMINKAVERIMED